MQQISAGPYVSAFRNGSDTKVSLAGAMRSLTVNDKQNVYSQNKKGFKKTLQNNHTNQASSKLRTSQYLNMPNYFPNFASTPDISFLNNDLFYPDDFFFGTSGRLSGVGEYNSSKLTNGLLNQNYSSSPTTNDSSRNSINSVTRKNRMVEMTSIGDDGAAMMLLSDPSTGNTSLATRVVKLAPRTSVVDNCDTVVKKSEPLFSRKVFVGGLPIDVHEEEVWTTFAAFGKVLVDWPRRPEHGRGDYEDTSRRGARSVSGYVFLVFEEEESVQRLVKSCGLINGRYYLAVSSPTMRNKPVQVRPWRLADIDYFADSDAVVDPRRTVFIGGVPRPTRAVDLADCLEPYYGRVSYVGIDIDPELKYPKGAARVTFATAASFVAAISGRFVQVNHSDTSKRVEIKPYVMEEQICDECEGQLCRFNYAPYFCGDSSCLQYYCESCWDRVHYVTSDNRSEHRPMVRTGDQTKVLPRPPHHSQMLVSSSRRIPISSANRVPSSSRLSGTYQTPSTFSNHTTY